MRPEASRRYSSLPALTETLLTTAPLRPATPRDFDALTELSRTSRVFTELELASLGEDLRACDVFAGDHIVVAPDETGRPLGFIQFSPAAITEGTWYVYWIAVAKAAHGRGIGAMLLDHAEATIRRDGGRLILIETSSKPLYEATRRFYLGRSYALQARIPDYYADGDDQCVFWKRL